MRSLACLCCLELRPHGLPAGRRRHPLELDALTASCCRASEQRRQLRGRRTRSTPSRRLPGEHDQSEAGQLEPLQRESSRKLALDSRKHGDEPELSASLRVFSSNTSARSCGSMHPGFRHERPSRTSTGTRDPQPASRLGRSRLGTAPRSAEFRAARPARNRQYALETAKGIAPHGHGALFAPATD